MTSRPLVLCHRAPFGALVATCAVLALLTLAACASSVAPNDASTPDVPINTGHPPQGCPVSPTPAIGTVCTDPGQTCGPYATPTESCVVIVCAGGHWARGGTPESCVQDAGGSPVSTALVTWQGPGGVAGTGPAIAVHGDGSVEVWATTSGFDPAHPPTTGALSYQVTRAAVQDLLARWAAVALASLPHPTGSAECSASVFVRTCDTCTPTTLSYQVASQVSPEMNDVWAWFSANIPASLTGGQPSTYCAF